MLRIWVTERKKMDVNSLPQSNASELSREIVDFLVKSSASFKVRAVSDLSEIVTLAEKSIEELGLTCRVYTENRGYAAGGAMFTGVGLAGVAAIAAHNVATWDPDYEIAKNKIANTVTIICKKPKEQPSAPGAVTRSTKAWWSF
jgi:hypothetical protein